MVTIKLTLADFLSVMFYIFIAISVVITFLMMAYNFLKHDYLLPSKITFKDVCIYLYNTSNYTLALQLTALAIPVICLIFIKYNLYSLLCLGELNASTRLFIIFGV